MKLIHRRMLLAPGLGLALFLGSAAHVRSGSAESCYFRLG